MTAAIEVREKLRLGFQQITRCLLFTNSPAVSLAPFPGGGPFRLATPMYVWSPEDTGLSHRCGL